MATTTVPGVKVTVSEGFYSATDNSIDVNADRVLIVARAADDANAGWQAGTPTNVLYNPTLYRSEQELVTDFGAGSDCHVAYVAALKAGARYIYVSALAPYAYHSTDSAKDPSHPIPADAYFTGITDDEFDLYLGLEHADRVAPSIIVAHGFTANEYKDLATDRVAKFARILVDRCKTLTEETGPCFGVMGVKTLAEHFKLKTSTALAAEACANTVGKSYQAGATKRNWVPYTATFKDAGVAVAKDDVLKVDWVNGTVTFKNSYTVNGAVTVDVQQYGSYAGLYSALDVAAYVTDLAAVAGTPATKFQPYPIASVTASIDDVTPTGRSHYLTLAVGDVKGAESDLFGSYVNAAAFVAGQIYSCPLDEAITLRPMKNVTSLAFDLTSAQRLEVIKKHAVPVSLTPSGLIATLDGITCAYDDANGDTSVYSRLSSVRIVHEVIKGTRGVLEPFIGMQASTARLNSIETKLRGYYMALKQNGLAKEIRFEMTYSISTAKLTVRVTVVPFGEIREIDITVDVALQ